MPKFPKAKNDILVLGARTMTGINDNPTIFTNPPYDVGPLTGFLSDAINKMGVRQALEGQLSDAVLAENNAIQSVIEAEEHLLRLAETDFKDDPVKLELLGWGKEADPRHHKPGQPRNLEIQVQGPTSAQLDWKAPEKTKHVGSVSFYRIERMIRNIETNAITEDWGTWQATTTKTEIVVHDQPRRVEIMYRIVANNPNGDGPHSDTETVVL